MNSLYQKRAGQPVQADQSMDMQEADLRYDYNRIDDPQARQVAEQAARQIRPILRRTAMNAWQVGNWANQVKDALPHGQFIEWAEAEFGEGQPGVQLSVRSLQRWMNVATEIPFAVVESSGMSLAGLIEVAAPSTPDAVRSQVLEHAAAGEIRRGWWGQPAPDFSDEISTTNPAPAAWSLERAAHSLGQWMKRGAQE